MTGESTTRLRLDLAYDGTHFSGWAKQPGLRTVQGVLEDALSRVIRQGGPPPALTVAGRTDAGVHALGQVAHLDLTAEQIAALVAQRRGDRELGAVVEARLRGILGAASDVTISRVRVAPPGFDARFSPLYRRYEYRIADTASQRNPLRRSHTVWYPAALDLEAMTRVGAELTGLADWAAYCRPRPGATTIRDLHCFTWHRDEELVLVARLQADAFCHSMVRALVGAAVAVGAGRLPGSRPKTLLDDRQRTSEFAVMPASGLTLIEVGYPDDAELAERAALTRAHRELTSEPLDG